MKAHPLELRQRIVALVDQQEHTIEEVAVLFKVSERHIYKLLKQRRETGELAPLPHGGGAVAKLDEPKLLRLAEFVAEVPDASLADLQGMLRRRCRTPVSLNTVWRGLQQIDFTRKKSRAAPAKPIPSSVPLSAKNKPRCR
jgi:transposase